jgi:lauroyl/myristoyl acyltransferase
MSEPSSGRPDRLILAEDIVGAAKLALGGIVVGLVPERYWRPLSRVVACGKNALTPAETRRIAERIRAVAGGRLALDPREVALERATLGFAGVLQILKVHHFRGFHPRLRVIGRAHIDAALERGRGAILWGGTFVSAHLIEPMALHQVGVPLHHLSNRHHGFSESRLAVRWLNPLYATAENRYLAERIVRAPGSFSALTTLRKRLGENRVVGMRASDGARWVLDLPFLDGRFRLATGPVELAMMSGAELLPMFAVGNAADAYEVHVEAPIGIRIDGDRKKTVADAAAEYVARLEPYVVSYPGQWMGWDRPQVRAMDGEDEQTVVEVPGSEFRD